MRTGRLGPILSCHLPQVPSSVAVLPQLRGRAAGCPPTVGGALALRAGPRLATLGAEALGGSTLSLGRRRRPRRALPFPLGTAPHPARVRSRAGGVHRARRPRCWAYRESAGLLGGDSSSRSLAGPGPSRPAETCWLQPRLGAVAGMVALPSHQLYECPWVSPFPQGLSFPICRGMG